MDVLHLPRVPLTAVPVANGSAAVIDASVQAAHILQSSMSADTTITLTRPVDGRTIEVWVAQDSTGGWLTSWVSQNRTLKGDYTPPDVTASAISGFRVSFETIGGTRYTIIQRIYPAVQGEVDAPDKFLTLTALEAWWRPDATEGTATTATRLLDKGTKGNHLGGGTAPTFTPGGGPNSTPILDFSGTTYLTRTAGFTLGANSWTRWGVVNIDTWAANKALYDMENSGGTNPTSSVRINTVANRWSTIFAPDAAATTTNAGTTGTWYLIRDFFDDANDLIGISNNNEADTTAAEATGGPTYVQASIGALVAGGNGADFKWADLFILRGKYRTMQNAYAVAYVNRRYSLGLT